MQKQVLTKQTYRKVPMSLKRFLNIAEAAEFIGYSESWLRKHHGAPSGPTRLQTSKGYKIRFREADLILWMEENRQ
jgi:predicted DNA-binding transcriptional regulator AlpA